MLSKKVLKDIQSLALKKHRDETGLFMAEGPKVVEELLALIPSQVQAVYATKEWAQGREGIQVIEEADLQKISQLKTPNQVLAVLNKMESKKPDGSGFTLFLDAVQDPGNMGTIIRIADWFGVKNIVCGEGCADPYNPKVIQSSMASIARVAIYEEEAMEWLSAQTVPVYAAVLQGESIYAVPKTSTGILVIGNESKGIRENILALATQPITIPRRGEAESLNAAVATGILLSHLLA